MADGTYFDRDLETRPWADVSAAAFAKAQRQFERVYDVSPFYRRKYTEAGVDPALIDSPADFAKLPFLTKDEERASQEEDPPHGGHLCVPAADLGLRRMLVGGEPGGQIPAVRRQIRSVWGCPVRDAMGMGEFAGALWAESDDEAGMHFCAQDEVYLELIDPDSGGLIPFEDGAEGELIYTAVERQAHPLVRFRSHDHVRVQMAPTPSGRTAPRITTLGRTDDMLLVRGINVFPSAVRDVVARFVPETTGHIQIVLRRPGPLVQPPARVDVEVADALPADRRDDVCRRLAGAIREHLSFSAEGRPVAEGTLRR